MIGIQDNEAAVWNIYSESVKPGERITEETPYELHESIVDALRPRIKQGVKTVLIASADEKDYTGFIDHVEKHHNWLLKGWDLNKATFEHVPMAAMDERQVRGIVKTNSFKEKLSTASTRDLVNIMKVLEERLNDSNGIDTLLFSLDEVEAHVYGGGDVEYLLVTDQFHERHRRRTSRLLQISANRKIQTKIIPAETATGARVTQFGGLVCLTRNP
jgi:stalled ribosome rescue protein Dom34